MKYLFLIICFSASQLSFANCIEKDEFVYAVAKLNKLMIGEKRFRLYYQNNLLREGEAIGQHILGNLLSLKYEFNNGSQGAMLVSRDIKNEQFSMAQLNDGDGVIEEISYAKYNFTECNMVFVSKLSEQVVEINISQENSLKVIIKSKSKNDLEEKLVYIFQPKL